MNTVKQAAQKLAISQSLVYALCKAGKIRHARHGVGRGTLRISDDALEEYRQAAEVKPAAPAIPLRHIRLSPS